MPSVLAGKAPAEASVTKSDGVEAEIEAAIAEEREARRGLGWREAFFGKGNFVRFVIAFVIFFLQQWAGQNSVSYYAPQIFTAVRILLVILSI